MTPEDAEKILATHDRQLHDHEKRMDKLFHSLILLGVCLGSLGGLVTAEILWW